MDLIEDSRDVLRRPETFMEKIRRKLSYATHDSVMEPSFWSALTAKRDAPMDFNNLESIAGGAIRKTFIDPIKHYAETIDKGMTGQQLSIQDLLNITEMNLDLVAGGGFTAALSKKGLSPNTLSSFPAWHGSPHKIDRAVGFADKAIGTGEGVQAFGRGHYLTDSKGIAEGYSKLGENVTKYDGKILQADTRNPAEAVKIALAEELSDTLVKRTPEEAKDAVRHYILKEKNKEFPAPYSEIQGSSDEVLNQMLLELDKLDPNKISFEQSENLYKTTVHKGKDPSEYSYLDWHKPIEGGKIDFPEEITYKGKVIPKELSEEDLVDPDKWLQFEMSNYLFDGYSPKDALKEIKNSFERPLSSREKKAFKELDLKAFGGLESGPDLKLLTRLRNDPLYQDFKLDAKEIIDREATGEDFYHYVDSLMDDEEDTVDYFKKLGISGVKYDAGTLSGGNVKPGTKNYVVFDPKDITIEEHYINNKLAGE